MRFKIDRRFVYYFQAVDIAFISRVAPGEQAVSAKHNPSDAGVVIEGFFQFQSQLKARLSPGNPGNLPFKKIFGNLFPFFGSGNGNGGIRVEVVDVLKRQESM